MKSTLYTAAAAVAVFGATNVAAHATFQDLWINGVDYISRPPLALADATSVRK